MTLFWIGFQGQGLVDNTEINTRTVFRLTDKETGITVVAQGSKSRQTNLKEALNELARRLVDYHYPKEIKERAPEEDVVRTYNECENRVVDKASGNKSSYKKYDIDEDIINRKLST